MHTKSKFISDGSQYLGLTELPKSAATSWSPLPCFEGIQAIFQDLWSACSFPVAHWKHYFPLLILVFALRGSGQGIFWFAVTEKLFSELAWTSRLQAEAGSLWVRGLTVKSVGRNNIQGFRKTFLLVYVFLWRGAPEFPSSKLFFFTPSLQSLKYKMNQLRSNSPPTPFSPPQTCNLGQIKSQLVVVASLLWLLSLSLC